MESLFEDTGVHASVVFGAESDGPITVSDDVKKEYRDVGPGELRDIRIASIWSFDVALFALQNPTPENIDRALELIGTSGDVDDWLDEETFRPKPVPLPSGFAYERSPRGY